jgi:hypothetical protein
MHGRRYPRGFSGSISTSVLLAHSGSLELGELGALIRQASRESQQAPEIEGQDAEDLFLSKVGLKSARQVAKRFAHVRVKIDGDAVTALPTRADGPGWSHIPQESAGHVTSPTDDQLGEVVVRVFKLCRPTIDLNSPN